MQSARSRSRGESIAREKPVPGLLEHSAEHGRAVDARGRATHRTVGRGDIVGRTRGKKKTPPTTTKAATDSKTTMMVDLTLRLDSFLWYWLSGIYQVFSLCSILTVCVH